MPIRRFRRAFPSRFRRRRRYEWVGASTVAQHFTLGGSTPANFAILIDNSKIQTWTNPTLQRIRGEYTAALVHSGAGTPPFFGMLSMGIQVATLASTGVGAPVDQVENPFSEIASNRWLWYDSVPLAIASVGGLEDVIQAKRGVVDARSKRRLGELDQLIVSLSMSSSDASNSTNVLVQFQLRMLVEQV